jgi:hypothetical protein
MHNVSAVAERGWGGTSPPPAGHCGDVIGVVDGRDAGLSHHSQHGEQEERGGYIVLRLLSSLPLVKQSVI